MPKLIIICGGSGSGKTTFSKILFDYLSENSKPVIISQDTYYLDKHLIPKTRTNKPNFDHPDAFDWKRINTDIHKLLNNELVIINKYDYKKDMIVPTDQEIKNVDYIIFEGLLSLYDSKINNQSILNIFIDEKSDECLIRRIKRDINERGRTLDLILEQWRDSVAEMFHIHIKNLKYKADIICPNINNKNVLNMIKTLLKN